MYTQWETAHCDFENVLLDSDMLVYLYEPEYSHEELRQIEEEATAAEQALPVGEDEEPEQTGGVPVGSVRLWTLSELVAYQLALFAYGH